MALVRIAAPLIALLVGCAGPQQLVGAGSSFVAPLMSHWAYDYAERGLGYVNYQAVGSGAGQQQLASGTVDFAASDVPMSAARLERLPAEVVQIPIALGAVAVAYRLDGLDGELRLDGPALAGLFLGEIGRWTTPAYGPSTPASPCRALPSQSRTG
jgi:phosphate transport system substrate-binding protein